VDIGLNSLRGLIGLGADGFVKEPFGPERIFWLDKGKPSLLKVG